MAPTESRAFVSAGLAFAFAFREAKAGRRVRLGKQAGAWRVTVTTPIQPTIENQTARV